VKSKTYGVGLPKDDTRANESANENDKTEDKCGNTKLCQQMHFFVAHE